MHLQDKQQISVCELCPWNICHIFSADVEQICLACYYLSVDSYLVDWIIEVWRNSHLFKCINLTNGSLGCVQNHTQPKQPGTSSSRWSPDRSHTAGGRLRILQPAFAASRPTRLCWSLWHKQHTQADPTSVQWRWGQDCWQPRETGDWLRTVCSWLSGQGAVWHIVLQTLTADL